MMEKSMEKSKGRLATNLANPFSVPGSTTCTEKLFAEVLADVIHVEPVSVDSHFFADLGANSLLMAQFCARVRKRGDLPAVSMKDIYRYPTIRSLTTALAEAAPPAVEPSVPATIAVRPPASTKQYIFCGLLQLVSLLGYAYLIGLTISRGYDWISAGSNWLDSYLRALFFVYALLVGLCIFPIVAKWILIGRWKAGEFPVWSLAYVRFWIVKALIHINPMVLFVGTPLYVLYLRAMGARIGKGVTILSRTIPVCTDLLTIGAATIIRKDAIILCYRAHAGRIQTGTVTLGQHVYIGERTLLDINTAMGDGAQLGHTSALQCGMEVPPGQHWHGSPPLHTQLDYVRVAPANCGTLRRVIFGLYTLFVVFFIYIPLAIGCFYLLDLWMPELAKLLAPDPGAVISPELYLDALTSSLLLFFGFVVIGLVAVFTVPRLLHLTIKPDTIYPLYGFHYAIHRAITSMSNSKFFNWLFGDSSYIVYYLRILGYDLGKIEQTGANFGTQVQHETPYLTSIGGGTMVCDGLSIINADFSNTSFCARRISIGTHNFLGNGLAFPPGAHTGDNCLLATKAMVPLDGELREGVGLLGSPCFEIPRSVERDSSFDHLRTGDELRTRLAAKNRYNLCSIGMFLFIRWLHVFALMLLSAFAIHLYQIAGAAMFAANLVLDLLFSTAYFVLLERAIMAFGSLRPQFCSIYDPYYWWHERLWKVPTTYLSIFNGTPLKNVIWRLLGVRLGRRVFDDGCLLTERSLVTIGDDCTLNATSTLQGHSLEDGTFKSDHITLGANCTLGVGAFVHYGVTIGDGALLAADSFLMKGEEIPQHSQWGGNPARAMTSSQLPAARSGPAPAKKGLPNHLDTHAHLSEQNAADTRLPR